MQYFVLKSLHILSVVLFLGNIITGVFWKMHGDRLGTTTARARDPMRPGAARNLSSLTPASGASTVQSVSDIFRHGSASRYNLRVRQQ